MGAGACSKPLIAGCVYWAIVFAAGFALGAVRTLAIAPLVGETTAVFIELPLMLAISWVACGWGVRRFAVPPATAARLIMGATAFALLMAAEIALSLFIFGRSIADFLAGLATPAGAAGFAGQIAFGLMPGIRK